jgi:hypothetical protein
MKGLISVVVVTVVVFLVVLSASYAQADWITVPSYSQGYLTIPDVGTFYSWKNPREDMTAYTEVVLNPGNSFDSNTWNFAVDSNDSSKWTMSLDSSIWLNTPQGDFEPITTMNLVLENASLSSTVRMFHDGNMNEDGITRSYTLDEFLLTSSNITGTTLVYDYADVNCGGIIRRNWLLNYRVSGEFTAIPEPGTIVLMLGALSGLLCMRRKK